MCRLLGLIGTPPLPAKDLLSAFQPLCKTGKVKCNMEPGHLDGWGVSGFQGGRAVYFERRAESAASDPALFRAAGEKAQQSRTPVLIAHLRKASTGTRSVGNTHPFHHRDWSFAHNGTVHGAMASLPLTDSTPQGETDSELLMLWILEHIQNEADPTEALVKLLKESRENLVFTSLTFLLSDGKTLWAYRDYGEKRLENGETLQDREKYYTLYYMKVDRTAVVCSETLPSVPGLWQPIAQRQLAVFTPDKLAPDIFKI